MSGGRALLERDERAVLERLDRALGLAEDRRRLLVRAAEDALQRQHLLLLVRELLDQLEHARPADRLPRFLLGRRLLRSDRFRRLLLRLPATAGAEVVHGEVVRDPE